MPVSPALLQELLVRHGAALELMAGRWCDEPEDCLQEAIVRLACQDRVPDAPAAWLYRVVRNEAISRGRRATARRRHETAAGQLAVRQWFAAEQPSVEISPEQAAEALAVLDGDALELVLMRIWGGLTLREIAAATDTSIATAHRRYRDAMTLLRANLEAPCPRHK